MRKESYLKNQKPHFPSVKNKIILLLLCQKGAYFGIGLYMDQPTIPPISIHTKLAFKKNMVLRLSF